jgi:hypothetical protein
MIEKVCESCGMPMKEVSDFGGGNQENKYCRYCINEKGELKDFQTKLAEMIYFTVTRMNIDHSVAEKIAKENMSKMPAWKDCF